MRWPYFLQHKLKIALLLCVILMAVFVNNRIEFGNITRLGSSFASVYEDRLVVESYIFQLSNHLHNKKHLVNKMEENDLKSTQEQLKSTNRAINLLLSDFEETQLTTQEDSLLQLFKEDMNYLEMVEISYLSEPIEHKALLEENFRSSFQLLAGLSAIQIHEGKTLYEISQRVVVSNASSTKFELVLIIIIGLIILALIFESKQLTTNFKQNIHLN